VKRVNVICRIYIVKNNFFIQCNIYDATKNLGNYGSFALFVNPPGKIGDLHECKLRTNPVVYNESHFFVKANSLHRKKGKLNLYNWVIMQIKISG